MKKFAPLVAIVATAPSFAGGIGPTPYFSFADSPFNGPAFEYFHLEDFEDGVLNTPGVTLSAGATTVAGQGPQTDSVDGDDGAIDGFGTAGRSLLALQTNTFRFDFDPIILGGLPTHAGIVWTDVGLTTGAAPGVGIVDFRAFDAANNQVAFISNLLGDGSTFGGTAEDRFHGAVANQGIAYITITMPDSQDWEIDHLQYGLIPSPAAALVLVPSSLAIIARRRRV